jgi:hypothetical protein
MASLFFTYRKHLGRPSKQQKSNGQLYAFDMNGFIKSLPHDQQEYLTMLRETQGALLPMKLLRTEFTNHQIGFNEFIHDREIKPATDPTIRLFDEIIMAKKARGRPGLTSSLSRLSTIRAAHGASLGSSPFGHGTSRSSASKIPGYLSDTGDHIWRTASVPVSKGNFPGEYRAIITRVPARLDRSLMREPRAIYGVPRIDPRGSSRGLARKQVPSMLGTTPPS